jgi:eukaryotic-like serine/threonine-protein kinase
MANMEIGPIGTFQILGTLGSGAHSTILHIRRSSDSKQYALKVVPLEAKDDAKFLEQARHEVEVAQMLEHPNLIKVYTLETPRDWLFRVRKAHVLIEYVNGKTLDTIKGLSVPRLVQVFEKIAAGLVHMHRRGVCHADLKPNNILLSKTGEVKIIDYGLAWIKGQSKNRVQGTPEYMAPEQARNSMVNERTDIYNFGATMYRLLTWRLPPSTLVSADGMAVDKKTFRNMLKPVGDLVAEAPPVLCDVVHRCLEFEANKRPERVSEIQGTLDHLVDDLVKSPEDSLDAMEW